MTDTHRKTKRRYVVTETVIDCDGSCVEGTGVRPESTISWDLKMAAGIVMSDADYEALRRAFEFWGVTRKDAEDRYIVPRP